MNHRCVPEKKPFDLSSTFYKITNPLIANLLISDNDDRLPHLIVLQE